MTEKILELSGSFVSFVQKISCVSRPVTEEEFNRGHDLVKQMKEGFDSLGSKYLVNQDLIASKEPERREMSEDFKKIQDPWTDLSDEFILEGKNFQYIIKKDYGWGAANEYRKKSNLIVSVNKLSSILFSVSILLNVKKHSYSASNDDSEAN
ncbi:hypothetical protein HY061_00250 [Candidatus Azambacteria bacterium]|nr:hypothetical protein [Candidatus Azambacteria bacterium]